jgi:hypothetical protein
MGLQNSKRVILFPKFGFLFVGTDVNPEAGKKHVVKDSASTIGYVSLLTIYKIAF